MIGHLLNTTVTVWRATYAADGRGGRTRTVAAYDTVRAKVDQPYGMERMVAGQEGETLTHVVHLAYGADVRRGDELDIGGPRRIRVKYVTSDSHRTYQRLECEELQGE